MQIKYLIFLFIVACSSSIYIIGDNNSTSMPTKVTEHYRTSNREKISEANSYTTKELEEMKNTYLKDFHVIKEDITNVEGDIKDIEVNTDVEVVGRKTDEVSGK